jgi:hypothetical protein
MMRNRSHLALAAFAALALAGCSDNALGPGLDQEPLLTADVAQVAAEGAGEDVEVMRDPTFGFLFGLSFSATAAGPRTDGCSFDGEWYSCGPIDRGGLTFFRQVAFYDAAGAPMPAFDENQTASVRIKTSIEGEVSHNGWSASIDRERDMTVSGLQGDEQTRIWNGTGSSQVSRSRHTEDGPARTYNMDVSTVVSNVVVPHFNNDQKDPWPLSGTITKTVHVEILDGDGNVLREATRTVTITFNGTQFASLTVTGPNGTHTFEVDLAGRRAHRKP